MVPRAILSLVIRRVLLVIIISFFFTVTREKFAQLFAIK